MGRMSMTDDDFTPMPEERSEAVVDQSLASQDGEATDPPALASLLATLESEIVEAGEACTEDYQALVDWTVIDRCVENVKAAVRDWCRAWSAAQASSPCPIGQDLRLPAPPDGCRWGLVDYGHDGGWQIVAVQE